MKRARIYIVAKTYPTISTKYAELVCTAGILENGDWVRLYPIPFRKLDFDQRYAKYSWVEANIERNTKDFRHETYRLVDLEKLVVERTKPTKVNWHLRKEIIFKNKKIFTNKKELIAAAKNKELSLAVFKPTEIIDFVIEPATREWNKEKVKQLDLMSKQLSFLDDPISEFKLVNKLPYNFSYKFLDDSGESSTLQIIDWEIGMLYWNCLKNANGVEDIAIEKVKQKYMGEFSKKDLYFFMGTQKDRQLVSRNPFLVIGVFCPPYNNQITMFE